MFSRKDYWKTYQKPKKNACLRCNTPTHNLKYCSRRCAGIVNTKILNTAELFWSKVDKSAECWLWQGKLDAQGYGVAKLYGFSGGHNRGAHRIAYYLEKGDISQGLVLDHLCRTPQCVNPSHLEAVTQHENQRRSPISMMNKTHCIRGHEFNDFNTRYERNNKRVCRWCSNIRHGLSTRKYEEYAKTH